MRAVEQAAINSGQVTGLELMERAGRGVVEAVFAEWPNLAAAPHRAIVLCGPGNNGGDGFVVARLLTDWGWEVEVFLYGDPAKLPLDAKTNYDRWCTMGQVLPLRKDGFPFPYNAHFDLVFDALFGTGLTRAVTGEVAEVLQQIRMAIWPFERSLRRAEHLVSIDIPTSLCADSGMVLEDGATGLAHFRADLTVTFHRAKLGHMLGYGPELSGNLVVKDIGLPRLHWPRGLPLGAQEPVRCAGTPGSSLQKEVHLHKFSHGHAFVLSGGLGRSGAARLAASGALRVGAGLVTVAAPPEAMPECAAQLTAIMLRQVDGAGGLAALLDDPRINALCLGPGLGLGDESAEAVAEALKSGRAMVLDADALTLVARDPALFSLLHDKCVLTPHAGEFARLFPDIAEMVDLTPAKGPAYSKVDATREAAARAGCTVLFKGPDTVIADAKGRCRIHAAAYDRAAPWLATAGSGDVLAGIVTGLLARGLPPNAAAEDGAWLHVECARAFGPGLIAEDLPEMLPKVLRALSEEG